MSNIKNKNIKWWVGRVSCMILFVAIGLFSYMKMGFLMKGVRISANIEESTSSSLVKIKGKAMNATYISLNGREIYIDKDGSFEEQVSLPEGLSIITLDAQDKFGKQAFKEFEILHKVDGSGVAFNTINSKIN